MKITTLPKEITFSWPMWVVTVDGEGDHCYAMFSDYTLAKKLAYELSKTYTIVNVLEVWDTLRK